MINNKFTIKETDISKGISYLLLLLHQYYFQSAIYSLWYPMVIYIVLLAVCLILSVGIQKLKELVRYSKFQNLLIKIIDN